MISKVTFAQILDEFYFANQLAASGPLGSRSDVVKVIQDKTTGNFIVAGTYKGGVALDISNPLNTTFSISVTSVQSFVAMYNSSGKYLWSASIYSSPTSANDSVLVSSIDVDDVGNIYVVGRVNVTSGDTIRVSSPYTIKKYLGIVNRAAFFTRINPYNPSDPDQYIDVIPASSSATVFINDCKFVKLGGVPTLILAGKFKGGV
ncbi:MAG: hypothetical protein RML94_14505, partial [Bacteroidia bacterium]|nr:hypothetical protein [Bacteroidia bacterium]